MKFNILASALLLSGAEAVGLKAMTQAEMLAKIEEMSMATNMHQISVMEKTLLKTHM